uniref:ATP synthase F0 subunit 8 n=1 Tax=Lissorhoptrus oryzophilus TaxID=308863 RepID=UPI001BEF3C3A|nr:ATP synthase F0 subunit 8 [Lissorhoptrus oryzophilus]QUA05792.1 ATP synthase F0 subunit 8 [Lissorhoptrus oryzophilus]
MPQMAPMNWTFLMMFFISIFLIFNISNFFMILYNPKEKKSKKKNYMNWKW